MEKVSSSSAQGTAADSEEQHEEGTMTREQPSSTAIVLPGRILIVLCGPAGAGKSTFARRFVEQHKEEGYRPTSIVSSDHCRALVCDNENNQQVNSDTFDLFYFLVCKRLSLGRPTIADSTALQYNARQTLLGIGRRFQFQTCLFVFNMSLQTCVQHDLYQARGRVVGEEVIASHIELLHKVLPSIPNEGWDYVYILDEHQYDREVTIQE